MTFKSLKKRLAVGTASAFALVMGLAFVAPQPASAADAVGCPGGNSIEGGIEAGAACAKPSTGANTLFGDDSVFKAVTDIMLFLIGAISVIMLIVGGIQYVMSGGEQAKVTGAKNTILYAIIGIVVAFLAYAAVGFVSSQLRENTDAGSVTSQLI